jgi:hypothetical protein
MAKEVIEHTFFHELTHCLLERAGYEKLSEDEQLVDTFSGFLYQFIKDNYTAKK